MWVSHHHLFPDVQLENGCGDAWPRPGALQPFLSWDFGEQQGNRWFLSTAVFYSSAVSHGARGKSWAPACEIYQYLPSPPRQRRVFPRTTTFSGHSVSWLFSLLAFVWRWKDWQKQKMVYAQKVAWIPRAACRQVRPYVPGVASLSSPPVEGRADTSSGRLQVDFLKVLKHRSLYSGCWQVPDHPVNPREEFFPVSSYSVTGTDLGIQTCLSHLCLCHTWAWPWCEFLFPPLVKRHR